MKSWIRDDRDKWRSRAEALEKSLRELVEAEKEELGAISKTPTRHDTRLDKATRQAERLLGRKEGT